MSFLFLISDNNEDTSSIPMIASGKRQHNIMRFGKRPAGGHNLIHFGKRESLKTPQHSFLYFGKRANDQESLPDILQYLQKSRDNSYKRGHTIMRFGKRDPGTHSFIRFGRGEEEDDYDGYYPDYDMDDEKRGGHQMLYFGKRGGHSMLYFGKRAPGHKIMSFGKRDDDKRAHAMIHFGKRDDDDEEDDMSPEDKRAHSMIHFGKRDDDDDAYIDELKRASHSMIHFGKRDFDDENIPFYWNPAASEKRQHNLLRFGKKTDGVRKGAHAMIHFGKRDDDKRAHQMIHFGKRSVDQNVESSSGNQSEAFENGASKALNRMKRNAEESVGNVEPLVALIHYGNNDEEDGAPEEDLENAIRSSQANVFSPAEVIDNLSYPDFDEQSILSAYPDYRPIHKKEASKNVFLRFG